jgi:hypothetical protein
MNWIEYNETTRQAIIRLTETAFENAHAWRLDHLGSIVEKILIHQPKQIIECSQWPKGIWFIKVEAIAGVQLKKIIIN